MKKLLSILFFAIAATLPSAAQHMMVEKNGTENEIIRLDNLKEITFNGPTVNIEQSNGTKSSTAMENISRIYFGDFSSIDGIEDKEALVEYLSSDGIAVNCPAGTTVTIYSVTGIQVMTARQDTDGGEISIAGLTQGIYIIKANERTAKIVRR
ncbi:MAG: T9SS type A sorting domain-containing protein [Bacteroidaceae bacterium]|nr:T9SS type A sorting domain-containing protein [Bacteroidaceae bacterium]